MKFARTERIFIYACRAMMERADVEQNTRLVEIKAEGNA